MRARARSRVLLRGACVCVYACVARVPPCLRFCVSRRECVTVPTEVSFLVRILSGQRARVRPTRARYRHLGFRPCHRSFCCRRRRRHRRPRRRRRDRRVIVPGAYLSVAVNDPVCRDRGEPVAFPGGSRWLPSQKSAPCERRINR